MSSASTTNGNTGKLKSSDVQIVTNVDEKATLAKRLSNLSSTTEMKSYGIEQWQYLLKAGDVTPLIITNQEDESNDDEVLGCVLRVTYGSAKEASSVSAYGMMLVSPKGRGQGLARKLLESAMAMSTSSTSSSSTMAMPAEEDSGKMHILGTCTEMGRPFYEKVGYQRVSTVTRMTVNLDEMKFAESDITKDGFHIEISKECPYDLFRQFLALDEEATGLDRSESLTAIEQYPYVQSITIITSGTKGEDFGDLKIGAFITHHTDASFVMVGPIIGEEALLPKLLDAIGEHYTASKSSTVTEIALIVSDHAQLVQTLTNAGFTTAFELGAMTLNGIPMPGKNSRDMYLGLIHPTLG